jgi:hypothetical protein
LAVAAVVAAAWPLAQAAYAGPPPPSVPGDIQVPAGNKLFLVGHAVGVQIYSCSLGSNGYAWTLVAPRADLYGDNGNLVAVHFAGPTWRAQDGSQVLGRREKGVVVDPDAIPWLLLSAAKTTPGRDGDRLVDTTFVQRIATTGGLAPAAGDCSAATVGTTFESPYTADYDFWKATGS